MIKTNPKFRFPLKKMLKRAYSVLPFNVTIIATGIYVFGNSFIFSPGDWKSELLEYIDEDNLPEYYGGKCRDPGGNPKCQTKVDIDL